MFHKSFVHTFVCATGLGLGAIPAAAAVVEVPFTAMQTGTFGSPGSDILDDAISLSVISGVISYDNATPDTNTSAGVGDYATGAIQFDQFASSGFVFGGIQTIIPFGAFLELQVVNAPTPDLSSALISVRLYPSDVSAFDADSLPDTLSLADFSGDISFLSDTATASFEITRLGAVAPVPLPATAGLMLLGLGGLAAARRR